MLQSIADLTGQKIRFKASGKEFIVEDRSWLSLLSKELKILLLFLQDDALFIHISYIGNFRDI